MEKKKSYAEMMKSRTIPRKQDLTITDVYIDMLLNEILLNQEKRQLMMAIDQALDEGDRDSFQELTTKLIQLQERFGM
ncbi:uncharacterized protein YpiB (UPF0302 family) [Oikeobacillus pervagus]|uniref:Uncharacterized protein YpiB (UPF0302 family) n=1 Tax=Oikeobacillus pervagus TaxID=1325931 RepID=A0AAJ1T2M2_9BACI|nr:IDEAL domain-containing protein [Oikeobacillus pervagus]MDQ0214779.1 uncharacterized protein YpiB (UPF0302 family) [Oikeobacillus pervagus]